MKVAIIGAGMAGLSCARALAQAGVAADIFDKGRGPGGRMSTRRVEVDGRELRFDHGAQYFTARDERFRSEVTAWRAAGRVAPWPSAGAEALVGVPGMNEPVRAMAEGLDVRWATRIDRLERVAGQWVLHGGEGAHSGYTSVVIAVPAEQAGPLAAPFSAEFADRAERTTSEPCWTVMACFALTLPLADTITTGEGVAWAARDGAKPGRSGSESWVLQASPQWTRDHLDEPPEQIATELLAAFFAENAIAPAQPSYLAAHRWLYAKAQPVAGEPALWDASLGLGLAGDWLLAPRIESAWISGRELADRMIATFE
ncbi:NAD(P)/FAD-dependent oxidoreductase [Qipengyuania sp. SM2507]